MGWRITMKNISAAAGDAALAALIRSHIPAILRSWEDLARERVPAAHSEERLALLDNMPVFLAQAADAVECGDAHGLHEMEQPALEHAEQRARVGHYSLDQVIHEYQLLRKAVVEILGDKAHSPGIATLHEAIDLGIRQSSSRYVSRVHTDFVTVVAHELRTPLSAITNALYILENMTIPLDQAGKHVITASRQTRQLSRLVEDLLDMGRISQGKIELRLASTDLSEAAREAVETVRPVAETRGQDLELVVPDLPVLVQADPVRLEQILTNLLNNAVKYTEPGGDICLTVRRECSHGIASVKDSGIGMDAVVLPQIFDMFHQVDPSEARSHGGLGVGLGLVRKLVELHAGTVAAESHGMGSGSTFVVRLPLTP